MLKLKSLLFWSGIFFSVSSHAHSAPPFDSYLKQLLEDTQTDIEHFDQFSANGQIKAPVREYLQKLRTWLKEPDSPSPPILRIDGKNWDFDPRAQARENQPSSTQIAELTLPDPVAGEPSSIEDIPAYIRARIGKEAYRLLSRGKLEPVVYGGSASTWQQTFCETACSSFRIPSPYEEWGIFKFYLPRTSHHKGRIVFVIPPLREYVLHYLAMFEMSKSKAPRAFLNAADRADFKQQFANDLNALPKSAQSLIRKAWLVFGYPSKVDEKMRVGGELIERYEGARIGLSFFRYRGEILVSISSKNAVWGEGAQFLLESFLPYHPKGVAFLGSAGYLQVGPEAYAHYSPLEFKIEDQAALQIKNIHPRARGTHVSTYSPLAETEKTLARWLSEGITSVDVEQSRVARAVQQFNLQKSTQIQFLAINLITDFPGAIFTAKKSEFNLDNVNGRAKDVGRKNVVDDAVWVVTEGSCEELLTLPAPPQK